MTRSMASVDSEGSWLSGKPVKRSSHQSRLRNSLGSMTMARHQDDNASFEEGVADEDYVRPTTGGRTRTNTAVTDLEDDYEFPPKKKDDDDEETLVHESLGRQPTVVHRRPSVKSREGLLNDFQTEEDDEDEDEDMDSMAASPVSPSDRESPIDFPEALEIKRATSVNLGHKRQHSAGSIKILDIPSRTPSQRKEQGDDIKEDSLKENFDSLPPTPSSPLEPRSRGITPAFI